MNIAVRFLILVALFVFQGDQKVVPVGDEPRHHVMFKNAYVRVIDASIESGDTTLFHTHAADNIPVVISGGQLRTELLGGKTTESTAVMGRAWFAAGGYTHRISNIGNTPVRFIDAEFISAPARAEPAVPDETNGMTLVLENDRVRVFELKLQPKETSGEFAFARPVLHVEVTGGSISTIDRGQPQLPDQHFLPAVSKPAEFHWHTRLQPERITNAGTEAYDSIIIEWK
jgi:hypothetical protein